MRLIFKLFASFVLAVFLSVELTFGQNMPKLSNRMAGRLAKGQSKVYEVEFSDAEESVLKGSQNETPEGLARLLKGRSVNEITRRCVELGLRCGDGASAPGKNTEKWRGRQTT